MKPLVSVILPTYNRSASLVPAVRSVLDQSYGDLELIVVDDASTEDIGRVVGALGDPRLRYVRREVNGGAAAARNTGLAMAEGHCIAFQDSDDLWLPGKLEKQVRLLGQLPPDVGVVTGTKVIYGRDDRWNYGPGRTSCSPTNDRALRLDQDQLKPILVRNRISLQNALFRLDCYPHRRWFDDLLRANVDWEFTVRLVQHTKIYMDLEPVVFARVSPDSVSLINTDKIKAMVRIYNKNEVIYRAYPKERSEMLFQIGVGLFRLGKRRLARRVVLHSLAIHPGHLTLLADHAGKYLRGRLGSLAGLLSRRSSAPKIDFDGGLRGRSAGLGPSGE